MKKLKIGLFIVFIFILIGLLGFFIYRLCTKIVSTPKIGETIEVSYSGNPVSTANNLVQDYFKDIIKNNNSDEEQSQGNFYLYKTKITNESHNAFIAQVYYEAYVKSNGESSVDETVTSSVLKIKAVKRPFSDKYVLEEYGSSVKADNMPKVNIVQNNELAANPNFINLPFFFKYDLVKDTLSLSNDDGVTWEKLPIKLSNMIDNYTVGDMVGNLQQLSNAEVIHNKNGIGIIYQSGNNVKFIYKSSKENSKWRDKVLDFKEDNATLMGDMLEHGHGYVIGTSSVAMGTSESYALITNNEGESWSEFKVPSGKQYGILTAGSIPTNRIAVVGYSQSAKSGINLKRTTDGGATWKDINIPTENYENPVMIKIDTNGKGILEVQQGNGKIQYFSTNDFGEIWKANG